MREVHNNWPEGLKKTRQRESVLSVLEGTKQPLSAVDICSQIEEKGETVWLSTVYRVLEIFEKKEVVVKTNIMNNGMAVYELNRFQDRRHYAVCINCHKIIAMNNCPMEEFKFTPKLEDKNFHIVGHNLELYGYCKDCVTK